LVRALVCGSRGRGFKTHRSPHFNSTTLVVLLIVLKYNKHMKYRPRIIQADDSKVFHSSGIARLNDSTRLGSTSAESFASRLSVGTNRQVIGGYQRSIIGNQYAVGARAKPIDASVVKKPITSPPQRQPVVRRIGR
jgi:hypothetical protein